MKLKQPKSPPKSAEMDAPPDADAFLEERVERAVAPYAELLPAGELEIMRETLRLYLTSHPEIAPLVDSLRARKVARSGDRPRTGIVDAPDQRAAGRKAKPGGRGR